MTVTLDWLGCATFRLQVDETVIMLDAYIDRVPLAPDVGLTAADILVPTPSWLDTPTSTTSPGPRSSRPTPARR